MQHRTMVVIAFILAAITVASLEIGSSRNITTAPSFESLLRIEGRVVHPSPKCDGGRNRPNASVLTITIDEKNQGPEDFVLGRIFE